MMTVNSFCDQLPPLPQQKCLLILPALCLCLYNCATHIATHRHGRIRATSTGTKGTTWQFCNMSNTTKLVDQARYQSNAIFLVLPSEPSPRACPVFLSMGQVSPESLLLSRESGQDVKVTGPRPPQELNPVNCTGPSEKQ